MTNALLSLFLAILTLPAHAQNGGGGAGRTLTVNLGSKFDFWTLIGNILGFLANAALVIAPMFFLVGVLRYVIGAAKGDVDDGKETMKGTLIGFMVIIGAYSILRTLYYFLQG